MNIYFLLSTITSSSLIIASFFVGYSFAKKRNEEIKHLASTTGADFFRVSVKGEPEAVEKWTGHKITTNEKNPVTAK
ncbi:MAG: hypothetical protein WCP97_00665 [bacterium]